MFSNSGGFRVILIQQAYNDQFTFHPEVSSRERLAIFLTRQMRTCCITVNYIHQRLTQISTSVPVEQAAVSSTKRLRWAYPRRAFHIN